jgi:lycopene beta-cyclase
LNDQLLPVKFDFIITGAGAAGLSLAMRLLQQGVLTQKTLAIIENTEKNKNDRTWCFWEKEPDIFEDIVCKKWDSVNFYSNYYSQVLDLTPYQYKMIKGLDFYRYCLSALQTALSVTFINATVTGIENQEAAVLVKTDKNDYTAGFCFNSLLLAQPLLNKNQFYFLQHFKGWMVKTDEPFFSDEHTTLMDFRISQQYGTTFMYCLPIDDQHALIEYTLFTEKLLKPEDYDAALHQYIAEYLPLPAHRILQTEFGIIPMTNYSFPGLDGRILHIGTAGGWTKASSGYTFKFIQRRTAAIAAVLKKGILPTKNTGTDSTRFNWYDATLLHVLKSGKMTGDKIFADFFKGNRPRDVLAFLDNETSLLTEVKIVRSLPTRIFLPAALQELVRSIF